LNNLKKENINLRERRITIYTIKTQDSTVIPISKKLHLILEKYNREIPKMSSQWYNRGLKKLCKLAGIDSRVQLTHYIGNVRKDVIKPKYELVSSHTARRTFITLSLKKGVLPEMVMKVSGHKDRMSFQSYVRISQEEAVDTMRDAWDS
jgi:integrase